MVNVGAATHFSVKCPQHFASTTTLHLSFAMVNVGAATLFSVNFSQHFASTTTLHHSFFFAAINQIIG